MPDTIDQSRIVAALRDMGVVPGDSVLVHSSFRSLGKVDGGPDAVIDALLSAVGEAGNVMMPTFNYSFPLPQPHYDPALTAGRTGALTEIFRKRPGAIRSLHPTHSVAAIGPRAEEWTRDHLSGRAMGVGSPIDRIAKAGGKVLLIGVGHTSNSTIHVAEEYAGVPKVSRYDVLPLVKVKTPDGTIIEHQLDSSTSCSGAFGAAESAIRSRGAITDGRLESCLMQIMPGQAIIDAVTDLLQRELDALLCNYIHCKPCQATRAKVRARSK